MGDDNDSEIPNFVPLNEHDEAILQRAQAQRVRLNDMHRQMIESVVAENPQRPFTPDTAVEDHAFVLRTLVFRHQVDEREWDPIVEVGMAERRSPEHSNG